jgi:hypothetical protein
VSLAGRITPAELHRALREPAERELEPVFSPLAHERFGLGLETIYEGYLVHYGRPRVFEPEDGDAALVLGDYLYAQGLARVASLGDVAAVADLAELISICAQGRLAEARAALSKRRDPAQLDRLARRAAGDEPVERALEAHARHMDR